jgi:hypothetical protein
MIVLIDPRGREEFHCQIVKGWVGRGRLGSFQKENRFCCDKGLSG